MTLSVLRDNLRFIFISVIAIDLNSRIELRRQAELVRR